MWNLFKVNSKRHQNDFNNEDTRTTSITSFQCLYCWLWTYFTPLVFLFPWTGKHLPRISSIGTLKKSYFGKFHLIPKKYTHHSPCRVKVNTADLRNSAEGGLCHEFFLVTFVIFLTFQKRLFSSTPVYLETHQKIDSWDSRNVFRIMSNIYNGALWRNSERFQKVP